MESNKGFFRGSYKPLLALARAGFCFFYQNMAKDFKLCEGCFFVKCQEIARKESVGKFWDSSFWFLEGLNVHPKYPWWGVTSVSFSVGVVVFFLWITDEEDCLEAITPEKKKMTGWKM